MSPRARHLSNADLPEAGRPRLHRRLSDKILAAFTHAYALGAYDIAEQLRRTLVETEALTRAARRRSRSGDRRTADAVVRADRWVAFVTARDRYNALCAAGGASARLHDAALADMEQAYERWLDGDRGGRPGVAGEYFTEPQSRSLTRAEPGR